MANLEHFHRDEFDDFEKMDEEVLIDLDLAREKAGIPFVITSDYRTPKYNREIGGVEDSAHTKGLAVDIAAHEWDRETRNLVIVALVDCGFRRIGEAESFIHADQDDSKPSPATWVYNSDDEHKA